LVNLRKSSRRYSSKLVDRELIERCLEAARMAPSACNSQPWQFVVVDQEETRKALAEKAFSGIYSMNRFAASAPVLIVVVRQKSRYAARLGGQFRGVQYNLIDLGIACEHLVLQAAEDGVDTCWLGWFNEKAVKKCLGLPRLTNIDLIISMGYGDGDSPREKHRKPMDEIRRYHQ
jgi:nitroreductase